MAGRPEVERQLHGGLTNQSFLVADGEHRAVVRINRLNADNLGIDRQREIAILAAHSELACVPDTLYVDAEVQVSGYIIGSWATAEILQSAAVRRRALDNLAQIQALQLPDIGCFSYAKHCRLFAEQLSNARLARLDWPTLADAAHDVDAADWTPVLCHHDLVPENVLLRGHEVFFIDWEYAALGHPAFDAVKLFGGLDSVVAEAYPDVSQPIFEALAYLQQGMDKLWFAVQDEG